MKRAVHLLLIGLCYLAWLIPTQAQTQQWQWANNQPFSVRAVATDAAGNAYVTGQFSGTITVGSQQFASTSAITDLIVAKFNAAGQAQWATTLGALPAYPGAINSTYVAGRDISVNPLTGEATVLGDLNGIFASSVPGTNLSADYSTDKLVVVKLSAGGQVQWTLQGGSTSFPTRALALATDAANNCYVTGNGYGLRLSNGTNIFTGSRQMFMFSVTGTAAFRWSLTSFAQLNAGGVDVATDAQNGAYLLGTYNGPLTIGGIALPSRVPGTVLARLNASTGAVQWARSDASGASNVAADAAGNCYLAGGFSGTYTLGAASLTAAAGPEGFLARFDAAGTVAWLKSVGPAESGASVALADAGPRVLLKRSSGVAALLGLLPDGSAGWEEQVSGVSEAQRLACVSGAQGGRVVVGGNCGGPASFGSHSVGSGNFLSSISYGGAPVLVGGVGVYPNPAQNQLNLILPQTPGTSALLFNAQGRVVWQHLGSDGAGASAVAVNVASWPRGFYTLRVISGGKVVTIRVQLI